MIEGDARGEIIQEPEIGMVVTDDRNDDSPNLGIIYMDSDVVLLRSTSDHHRLQTRRMFDRQLQAGRLKVVEDDVSGPLSSLRKRSEELEESDSRKDRHKAEAFLEAIELVTEHPAEDAREPVEFEEVDGVGASTADALREAGIETYRDVRDASDEELLGISGMGEKNLASLKGFVA